MKSYAQRKHKTTLCHIDTHTLPIFDQLVLCFACSPIRNIASKARPTHEFDHLKAGTLLYVQYSCIVYLLVGKKCLYTTCVNVSNILFTYICSIGRLRSSFNTCKCQPPRLTRVTIIVNISLLLSFHFVSFTLPSRLALTSMAWVAVSFLCSPMSTSFLLRLVKYTHCQQSSVLEHFHNFIFHFCGKVRGNQIVNFLFVDATCSALLFT